MSHRRPPGTDLSRSLTTDPGVKRKCIKEPEGVFYRRPKVLPHKVFLRGVTRSRIVRDDVVRTVVGYLFLISVPVPVPGVPFPTCVRTYDPSHQVTPVFSVSGGIHS